MGEEGHGPCALDVCSPSATFPVPFSPTGEAQWVSGEQRVTSQFRDDALCIATETLSLGGNRSVDEDQASHETLAVESLVSSETPGSDDPMDQLDAVLPLFEITDGTDVDQTRGARGTSPTTNPEAAAASGGERTFGIQREQPDPMSLGHVSLHNTSGGDPRGQAVTVADTCPTILRSPPSSSAAACSSGDLSTQFLCPICLEICEDAVETPCCHNLFCHSCLCSDEHVIESCPICKCRLQMSSVAPNVPIRRMIDDLPWSCRFQGCGATLRRRDRHRHESVCDFVPVACRLSSKCPSLLRGQLLKHETEECPFRPCVCPMCSFTLPLDLLDDHLEMQCPRVICKCSLCEEPVCRAELSDHMMTVCLLTTVTCQFPEHETGMSCQHRCERRALEEHQRVCPFKPVSCRHGHCGHVTTCRMLEGHEDICPYRVLPCPDCAEDVLLGSLMEHLESECPDHMVSCPFSDFGCSELMSRSHMPRHLQEGCAEHLVQLKNAVVEKDNEIRRLRAELGETREYFESRLEFVERAWFEPATSFGSSRGIHHFAGQGVPPAGEDRLPELASMATAWASPRAFGIPWYRLQSAEGFRTAPDMRPRPPPPTLLPSVLPPFGNGSGSSSSGVPVLPFTTPVPSMSDAAASSLGFDNTLRTQSHAQQRRLSEGVQLRSPLVVDRPYGSTQLAPSTFPSVPMQDERSFSSQLLHPAEEQSVRQQRRQPQQQLVPQRHSQSSFEQRSPHRNVSQANTSPRSVSMSAAEAEADSRDSPSTDNMTQPFLLFDSGIARAPVSTSGSNLFGGLATQSMQRFAARGGQVSRHIAAPRQRRVALYQPVGYRAAFRTADNLATPAVEEATQPIQMTPTVFSAEGQGSADRESDRGEERTEQLDGSIT